MPRLPGSWSNNLSITFSFVENNLFEVNALDKKLEADCIYIVDFTLRGLRY